MQPFQVGYFVGSLSSTSINRLLARAWIRLAPSGLEFTEIPFKDLPGLDRRLPGRHRHGRRAATPAQYPQLPQLAADERTRGHIQVTPGLIVEDGRVTNEKTEEFLRGFMTEFHGHVGRVYAA